MLRALAPDIGTASGDVQGPTPASSTDNAIARWDGTTGRLIQNSVVTVADTTGLMVWPAAVAGGVQVSDGAAATPSVAFASDTDTGFMLGAGNTIGFVSGGALRAIFVTSTGMTMGSGVPFSWASSSTPTGANADTFMFRDAANTTAQRNGTALQFHNIYGNFVSTTDYHRLQRGVARATLASVSGASVTATGLIPDGAVTLGVTTKVTVSLGTGSGTTGYAVGTGADPNRWGDIVGTAAGTSSDNRDATSGLIDMSIGATDVIITAAGGNFNGTGTIEVYAFYDIAQAD